MTIVFEPNLPLANPVKQYCDGQPFTFQPVSLHGLAVHLNRLLKFKSPWLRNRQAHEEFWQRFLLWPKLPKALIATLPSAVLEAGVQQVWWHSLAILTECPHTSNAQLTLTAEDQRLNQQLCQWDIAHFKPAYWLTEEIRQLAQVTPNPLHSGVYTTVLQDLAGTTLNLEVLHTILEAHGFLSAVYPNMPVVVAFLINRYQSYPLPLATFTSLQTPALTQEFPRLAMVSAAFHGEAIASFTQLLLVEGRTEKNLLPVFANAIGLSFDAQRWLVLTADGKSQMLNQYNSYAQQLNMPIAVILDADAQSVYETVLDHLRPGDQCFILSEGEMEDTYSWALMGEVINRYFEPTTPLTPSRIATFLETLPDKTGRKVSVLKKLWPYFELQHAGSVNFNKIVLTDAIVRFFEDCPNSAAAHVPESIKTILKTIAAQHPGQSIRVQSITSAE